MYLLIYDHKNKSEMLPATFKTTVPFRLYDKKGYLTYSGAMTPELKCGDVYKPLRQHPECSTMSFLEKGTWVDL
jgi:hypothetical protein